MSERQEPAIPPEALRLDEASLIQEACATAGLRDFGSDDFRPHLRALLDSLDVEGRLHDMGRATQHVRIVDSLVARLRAQAYFARHPEILDEELGDPIVIVGLARTGTTRLQRLMACDPAVHSAKWWELRAPAPPPDWDPAAPDPRVAEGEEVVRSILEAAPIMASIHPFDHAAADEEVLLFEHGFLSHVPESSAHVPSYRRHLDEQDLAPAYRYLKRMLQFLQWQHRRRGEQGAGWILKSPMHLGYIDELFEVFPGARVVQTHRDPVETVASSASMYSALSEMASDHVDRGEVGRLVESRYAWSLGRCLRSRDKRPEFFCDVWYRDVGRDPMREVRRIYEFCGRAQSEATEKAMQSWLEANARENRPPHQYSLEEFGLTRERIERDFAEYRERFIVGRGGAEEGARDSNGERR